MNRYAEYKESGVEWIGKIPSHWNLMPTKFVSAIYCGSTPNSHIEAYWDGNINWFTPSDLGLSSTSKYINSSSRKITNAGLNSYGGEFIKPNSLVLSTRAPVGKVGISTTEFTTNQGCKVLVTKDNVDVQYLYYFFSTNTVALNVLSNGTTFGELTTKCLSSFVVLNPSFREQLQISQFLDKKTSQIDSLIEKIERKIELLKEQRTALISQCVTKGLDPNAEMKNSGVEWIGEIPSHWEIKKLKRVSEIETGTTPPTINENYYNDGTTPWVKPENLNGMTSIKFTTRKLTELGVEKSRLLRANSVLVCGIGTIGKFGFATKPVCTNQQINGITFFKEIVCSRFGLYLISSMVDEFKRISEKVVVSILTKTRQQNCSIAFPSLNEQFSICQYLDKKTSQIDSLSEKLRRKIELLKEYRQSLISNVVTGKVKVTEDAS